MIRKINFSEIVGSIKIIPLLLKSNPNHNHKKMNNKINKS
jgi:hypothetical protein